ncbi:DUF6456 domain-containing protein [Paramylibacter ulvae]|uniref:DUF6456 domain-containing protein n=1 Tax=Paramylibacter ulvae TaxID=1651968 RepID=UPI001E287408|nr:DUF6456 domain-containing protein [Amylibacter ulvae]
MNGSRVHVTANKILGEQADCLSTNLYLAHTVLGRSLRSLAQEMGVHPSTVMRRVRRIEELRDDPLVDEYLEHAETPQMVDFLKERLGKTMTTTTNTIANKKVSAEDIRVLRRMCEAGAFMAISPKLENGAILRKSGTGQPTKTAVVSRDLAQKMTVCDWIKCTKNGAVHVYHVTESGRGALRRALSEKPHSGDGFAEAQTPFAAQHREFGDKNIFDTATGRITKKRVNLRESPLTMLARKKDSNGERFLSAELLQAGERLREDFELSQMGPRIAQNWDRFLTGSDRGAFNSAGVGGSDAAAKRLRDALSALGTGLGDIALRCCCYLEGLEVAEKRMGWSARSGKIVLRIALQRLRRHYEEEYGEMNRKIG